MSDPPHNYDDLFRAIGEVTVSWSYLETAVDAWIDAIWFSWGGQALGIERPRTSLGRKLDFIRKWYGGEEKWPVLFPDLLKLTVDRIDRLSDHRHLIIHGLSLDFADFPETGITTLELVKHKRGQRLRANRAYTVSDIKALRDDTTKLAIMVGAIVEIFATDSGLIQDRDDSLVKLLSKL